MLPTCDNFKRLMSDAYYRHILREFNHSMHFILPDPLFWMYIDENNIDDEPDTETPNEEPNQDKGQQKDGATNSNSEQENENFSKIISYLRSKYNPEEVIIFNLAVLKQQTCVQIAEVTGWKKKDVRNLLNRMERDIKDMLKKK
jgi:DNA-directed RNA polymerase specialized sigma24 family protein